MFVGVFVEMMHCWCRRCRAWPCFWQACAYPFLMTWFYKSGCWMSTFRFILLLPRMFQLTDRKERWAQLTLWMRLVSARLQWSSAAALKTPLVGLYPGKTRAPRCAQNISRKTRSVIWPDKGRVRLAECLFCVNEIMIEFVVRGW